MCRESEQTRPVSVQHSVLCHCRCLRLLRTEKCRAPSVGPSAQESSPGPAPHKDFSDFYKKMSGKGESTSEAHRVEAAHQWRAVRRDVVTHWQRGALGRLLVRDKLRDLALQQPVRDLFRTRTFRFV